MPGDSDEQQQFYLTRERLRPAKSIGEVKDERGRFSAVLSVLHTLVPGGTLGTVVDLGGSEGWHLAALRSEFSVHRLVCVDIYIPAEPLAGIEYFRGSHKELRTMVGDGVVDIILAQEIIEHVFDPDSFLEVCHSALKPDGLLILTTPNLSSLTNRLSLLIGWLPLSMEVSTKRHYGRPYVGQGVPVGHIRVFTFAALREMLVGTGFEIERGFTIPLTIFPRSSRPGIAYPRTIVRDRRLNGGHKKATDLTRTAGLFNLLERLAVSLSPRLGSEMIFVAKPRSYERSS